MPGQYDNPDDILDIGSSLKNEKTRKENAEKVVQLKEQYQKEQEKEQQKQEKEKKEEEDQPGFFPFLSRHKTVLFLLIILLVATGLRLYVASMPITGDWAEQVVTANLETQVKNKVYEEYPTLSDAKKAELVQQGVSQALAASQNQQAIETLSEQYKESYKDPEGNSYLYEIDPYFFYQVAVASKDPLSKEGHTLLAFIERWWYAIVQVFFPGISFVKAIFYLPLVWTLFAAVTIFFLGKELWNEMAGFIAALFFVLQPIVLEFSLLGFVDTNMANLFIIVMTGLLFLLIIRVLKETKGIRTKGLSFIILLGMEVALLLAFKYLWSAWYIALLLIAIPLGLYSALLFSRKILIILKEKQKRKYVFLASFILIILFFGIGLAALHAKEKIGLWIEAVLPQNVGKYLHLQAFESASGWPDAFALIKELQLSDASTFISYTGGNLIAVVAFLVFAYLAYTTLKKPEVKYLYLLTSFIIFGMLGFRAVRVLPYFIPFVALMLGIGITVAWVEISKKIMPYITKERRVFRIFMMILVWICIGVPFVYSLSSGIVQRTQLTPIMDDAIYNSATYIKENSVQDAIVSAWWDRGTFYSALAERTVHLQSQPYMPTTYWLSTLYMSNDAVKAKNILSLLNCHGELKIYEILETKNTTLESIEILQTILGINSSEEQREFLENALFSSQKEEKEKIINYNVICSNAKKETYLVVIDDMMPRFSGVEYFAAWDFAAQQPDPQYPYIDLEEGGCLRSQSGLYCGIGRNQFYLNLTNMNVLGTVSVSEVYLVNETVQYKVLSDLSQATNPYTLLVYNRAGYWKALYLPKEVADSMYIQLMILDGYNTMYFEKVFDEVHPETSWVKVYKVNWDGTEATESSQP